MLNIIDINVNDRNWSCMVAILAETSSTFSDYIKLFRKACILHPHIVIISPKTFLRSSFLNFADDDSDESMDSEKLAEMTIKKPEKFRKKGKTYAVKKVDELLSSDRPKWETVELFGNKVRNKAVQIKRYILEYKSAMNKRIALERKRGIYSRDTSKGNPSPGPHVYFVLTGFNYPTLVTELLDIKVPLVLGIPIGPDPTEIFNETQKEIDRKTLGEKVPDTKFRKEETGDKKANRRQSRRQSRGKNPNKKLNSGNPKGENLSIFSMRILNTVDRKMRFWLNVYKLINGKSNRNLTKDFIIQYYNPLEMLETNADRRSSEKILTNLSDILYQTVNHMRNYIHYMNSVQHISIVVEERNDSLFVDYQLCLEITPIELTSIEMMLHYMTEVVEASLITIVLPSNVKLSEETYSTNEKCSPTIINHKDDIQINLMDLSIPFINLKKLHLDIYRNMPYCKLWDKYSELDKEMKVRYQSQIYKLWKCSGSVMLPFESFEINLHQMLFIKLINLYLHDLNYSFAYMNKYQEQNEIPMVTKLEKNEEFEPIEIEETEEEETKDLFKKNTDDLLHHENGDRNNYFLTKFLESNEMISLFDFSLNNQIIFNSNKMEVMDASIFLQSLQHAFCTFSSVYYEYCILTDKIILWFQNDFNFSGPVVQVEKGNLKTAGFKDYYSWTRHEITNWLQSEKDNINTIDDKQQTDHINDLKSSSQRTLFIDKNIMTERTQLPLPDIGGEGGQFGCIYDLETNGINVNESVVKFCSIDGPSVTIKQTNNSFYKRICLDSFGNSFVFDICTIHLADSNVGKVISLEGKNNIRYKFEIAEETIQRTEPILIYSESIATLASKKSKMTSDSRRHSQMESKNTLPSKQLDVANSARSSKELTASSRRSSKSSHISSSKTKESDLSRRTSKSSKTVGDSRRSSKRASKSSNKSSSQMVEDKPIINIITIEEKNLKYNLITTLPNGSKITFLGKENDVAVKHEFQLDVMYCNYGVEEYKRIYLKDGSIILFKINGDVMLFKPDSTIFKILKVEYVETNKTELGQTGQSETEKSENKNKLSPKPDSQKPPQQESGGQLRRESRRQSRKQSRKQSRRQSRKQSKKEPRRMSTKYGARKSTRAGKSFKTKGLLIDSSKFTFKVTEYEKYDWSGKYSVFKNINDLVHESYPYKIRAAVLKWRELYVKRNDGTNCYFDEDGLLYTKFPDGTLITSIPMVKTALPPPEINLSDKPKKSDLKVKKGTYLSQKHVTPMTKSESKLKKEESDVKSTSSFEIDESEYVMCDNAYIIEHPKFARVIIRDSSFDLTLEETTNLFRSPDGNYRIIVDPFTLVETTKDSIVIESFKTIPESQRTSSDSPISNITKTTLFPLNFNAEDRKPICNCVDSVNRQFTIYSDGTYEFNFPNSIDLDSLKRLTYDVILNNRYFVMNRDLSGYELIPDTAPAPPLRKPVRDSLTGKSKLCFKLEKHLLEKIQTQVKLTQYPLLKSKTDKFRIPYLTKYHRTFKLKKKDLTNYLPNSLVWLFDLPSKYLKQISHTEHSILKSRRTLIPNYAFSSASSAFIMPSVSTDEPIEDIHPPLAILYKKETILDSKVVLFSIYTEAFYNYIWYHREIFQRYLEYFHIRESYLYDGLAVPEPTINVNLLINNEG